MHYRQSVAEINEDCTWDVCSYSIILNQNYRDVNPFIFIKNKHSVMPSEGFSSLEKRRNMFSEANAAQCPKKLPIQLGEADSNVSLAHFFKILVHFKF